MNLAFHCPACQAPSAWDPSRSTTWQCPACEHLVEPAAPAQDAPSACLVCGNAELYRKKDFSHAVGIGILTVACVTFFVASLTYHQWLGWTVLIASAVIDGGLYLLVRDVVVCYRCGAHHRGCRPTDSYRPFELGIGERYRQERLRREQHQAQGMS